jgi:hypothetical protein
MSEEIVNVIHVRKQTHFVTVTILLKAYVIPPTTHAMTSTPLEL